tara:strand:- start:3604 stop:4881 length:1278 start_codon:yes stop_codon:yes gene_type:complete
MKNLKSIKLGLASLLLSSVGMSQSPAVTAWVINTDNTTGYNCSGCAPAVYGSIDADIQSIDYTATDVYVTTEGVPSYDVGPWSNPNVPEAQGRVWKITLNPAENTGNAKATSLGSLGAFINGIGVYNPMDGYYWDDANNVMKAGGVGTWNRNAYVYEAQSFDACLGHSDGSGSYHNHVNPKCVYDYTATTVHSPIIGYAFDGFPIYGAFAYTGTDGTGAIKRMKSSYKLTTSSTRSGGPTMSQYTAGDFCEDYEYTIGYGDLDEHNGRYCETPEYPNGIYAYFVTTEDNGDPYYPFVVGPTYYGTVQNGNAGPQGGSNTIPGSAVNYVPNITSVPKEINLGEINVYPNPVIDQLVKFEVANISTDMIVEIIDYQGRTLVYKTFPKGSVVNKVQVEAPYLNTGVYWLSVTVNGSKSVQKIVFNDGF